MPWGRRLGASGDRGRYEKAQSRLSNHYLKHVDLLYENVASEGRTKMQESDRPNGRDAKSPEVAELPERTLSTYARLWQLETWLRRMVYVELRADRGDGWRTDVRNFAGSFEADKELGHMPTPETTPLSYTQFSELKRLISENWGLFSPYLPPQNSTLSNHTFR
jgi:hypothetical protein